MILYTLLALLFVFSDQITKFFAVSLLKGTSGIPFIPHIMEFLYVENRGIAFGMFQGKSHFIIPLTIVILAVCIYFLVYYLKKSKHLPSIALTFIIGGAIGNLIDKLRLGYVVDFLHTTFMEFPVFNLADVFICVGAGLFAIFILFFDKEEKNENNK
ncbi:MAG: signal peptidase II [Clostridia bacterium]|nr:signal peptidase II [Clostridia bacterium]